MWRYEPKRWRQLAKAIAELAGLSNASGSDTRGFCAAPAHALILAASLVQAELTKCISSSWRFYRLK